MENYIVCTMRSWGEQVFEQRLSKLEGTWHLATSTNQLRKLLNWVSPKYIFFIHWSEIVPDDIVSYEECICFHPSRLPDYRGGTPIQHQIKDGIDVTDLTAFKMINELDAGPVYYRERLSLKGTAEEIYIRMSETAADMILWIINVEIVPEEQNITEHGVYKRRKPQQSEISDPNIALCEYVNYNLNELFDHIRMLDAEGYPRAYLEHEGMRYTFSRPTLRVGKIVCDVEITEIDK